MADSRKVVEGVMAINKPLGISSAQVIRDMQKQFDTSKLFAPWIREEKRAREYNRHRGSKPRRGPVSVKIGHGGTLDVAARGVLVTGIGKGTKELPKFLECTKTYETVVLFGVATDSYDYVGKIVGRKAFSHITETIVREALSKFKGKIMQRPPIFSALRVEGKRLYEFAREGKEPPIEIKERPVEVLNLEMMEWLDGGKHNYHWPEVVAEKEESAVAEMLLHLEADGAQEHNAGGPIYRHQSPIDLKRKRDEAEDDLVKESSPESKRARESSDALVSEALVQSTDNGQPAGPMATATENPSSLHEPPAVKLRMTVTSGFYVRSLCHDLGKAVGSLAIMSDLVRTRQAEFELEKNVFAYDDLANGEDVWGPQVEKMLNDWSAKAEV